VYAGVPSVVRVTVSDKPPSGECSVWPIPVREETSNKAKGKMSCFIVNPLIGRGKYRQWFLQTQEKVEEVGLKSKVRGAFWPWTRKMDWWAISKRMQYA
jgi:hypothetical protein